LTDVRAILGLQKQFLTDPKVIENLKGVMVGLPQ
jgi:hypothetical protein